MWVSYHRMIVQIYHFPILFLSYLYNLQIISHVCHQNTLHLMNKNIQHALEQDSVIDITTMGRRSGTPCRIEIWHRQVNGRTYITGTPGTRDWYANLLEHPSFIFHFKESIELDLHTTARPITNPDERRQVLAALSMKWYHEQVHSIEDLVAGSPLVEVIFSE